MSLSGSAVTVGKLQDLLPTRPIVPPQVQWVYGGGLALTLAAAVVAVVTGAPVVAIVLGVLALVLGVLLVLPVGGADVPIVISLLNAFTGLAVAASGYLLGNTLLLVAGTLVGAAGTLLTRLMAQAMGRRVTSILFGALAGDSSTLGATVESTRPVQSAGADDIAVLLAYARRVVIVPGYGLAVAQAQHALRELGDVLADRGSRGRLRHPPGRRPDARPHERPARRGQRPVRATGRDEPGQPGVQGRRRRAGGRRQRRRQPSRAQGVRARRSPACRSSTPTRPSQVVFMKRSMRPGFAGIENELLYNPKTTLFFGDAKDSLTQLVAALKSA